MKILRHIFLFIVMAGIGAGVTYAAFTSRSTIKGASFSTGNAQIMLSKNNSQNDIDWTNELTDMEFENILPYWTQDYLLFLKNTGDSSLKISLAGSLAINSQDLKTLREKIHMSIWAFDDINPKNGVWDGNTNEPKTQIVNSAKTDWTLAELIVTPIDFGQIDGHVIKGIILTFSVNDLDETYNDAEFTGYNFTFNGTTDGAIQPTLHP